MTSRTQCDGDYHSDEMYIIPEGQLIFDVQYEEIPDGAPIQFLTKSLCLMDFKVMVEDWLIKPELVKHLRINQRRA